MRQTIAVDFDGTICKEQSYGDGEIIETPNEGASKVMKKLYGSGFKLIIFTTRLNPNFGGDLGLKKRRIEEWLKKHDIPYDEVTNNKPAAIAYIDDRAIRFTNWQDISNYFI